MEETGDTIAIARDVTDQRQMEALNTALEDSIAVEKMKSQLFAGISHEFKTPLNIILSSLDLLRIDVYKRQGLNFLPLPHSPKKAQ